MSKIEEIVVPIRFSVEQLNSCHGRLNELLEEVRAVMRRGDDAACQDIADVVQGLLEVLEVLVAAGAPAIVSAPATGLPPPHEDDPKPGPEGECPTCGAAGPPLEAVPLPWAQHVHGDGTVSRYLDTGHGPPPQLVAMRSALK